MHVSRADDGSWNHGWQPDVSSGAARVLASQISVWTYVRASRVRPQHLLTCAWCSNLANIVHPPSSRRISEQERDRLSREDASPALRSLPYPRVRVLSSSLSILTVSRTLHAARRTARIVHTELAGSLDRLNFDLRTAERPCAMSSTLTHQRDPARPLRCKNLGPSPLSTFPFPPFFSALAHPRWAGTAFEKFSLLGACRTTREEEARDIKLQVWDVHFGRSARRALGPRSRRHLQTSAAALCPWPMDSASTRASDRSIERSTTPGCLDMQSLAIRRSPALAGGCSRRAPTKPNRALDTRPRHQRDARPWVIRATALMITYGKHMALVGRPVLPAITATYLLTPLLNYPDGHH